MIAFSDEKGAYSQGVINMFKKAYKSIRIWKTEKKGLMI